jgi:hypothetical protein
MRPLFFISALSVSQRNYVLPPLLLVAPLSVQRDMVS